MKPRVDVSDSIKDTKVKRADFEALVKNLLRHPQTSKQEVSRKIRNLGRASRDFSRSDQRQLD